MSWLSSAFSSPNPVDRDEEKGGGGGRRSKRSAKKKRKARRRDSSDEDDDDDESESEDDVRSERERRRVEREERRKREDEEDLSRRDKLSEREKDALARKDRERERERRLRFEDKDDEADRRKKAEREAERKAEEEAREALRAENEMVQVQEAVPADDPFADDQGNQGPVGPKRVVVQYLGDMDVKFNNDATHLIWSALKGVIFLVMFAWGLTNNTASIDIAPCNQSTLVPWCVGGFSISTGRFYICEDRTFTDSNGLTCDSLCLTTSPGSGCYQNYTPGVSFSKGIMYCLEPAEFKAKCDNRGTCAPKFVSDAQKGYLPGVVMFFFMLTLEALHAMALHFWTGVHPDDYTKESKTRHMRFLLIVVKAYPFCAQLLAIVTAFCWIFLYISYNSGYNYCSDALTSDGAPISIFTQTLSFMICYVLVLVLVCAVGTYMRKFRPVRGELYNPSVDGELAPPCNADFKDMRERPAPRMCPELWADCEDPDSRMMCKPCATPCKLFWNMFFSMFLAPLGWLIEMFFRHRHFIGP